jgi:hypothetical protein
MGITALQPGVDDIYRPKTLGICLVDTAGYSNCGI